MFIGHLQKRRLAQDSLEFNLQDNVFVELFPEVVDEINEKLAQIKASTNQTSTSSTANNSNHVAEINNNSNLEQGHNWLLSLTSNIFVIISLAIFGLVVKYVLNT